MARAKQREAEQARAKRREEEAELACAADRELARPRRSRPRRNPSDHGGHARARRFPGSRRRPRRMPSLRSAILALAAGALFGPMFVFPLLPDAAAGPVIELQQWVSDTLG